MDECKEKEIEKGLYDFTVSAEIAAKERGCYVIMPKQNQLFIDIDSYEDYREFLRRIGELKPLMIIKYVEKPSRSGLPHRHIYVDCFNNDGTPMILNDWKRIALQFVLGSDRVACILSSYRALSGIEEPCRFFEPLPNEDL